MRGVRPAQRQAHRDGRDHRLFDADRLNLPRVGIEPDAQFLSTLAALGSPFSSQSRCLRMSFSSTYPPAERGFGLIS